MIAENQSLDAALAQMIDQADCSFRERVATKLCLILPRKRRELERAITELALSTGAIKPQSTLKNGVYTGDWRDIAQWVWEHRAEIFEFVMMIISLF